MTNEERLDLWIKVGRITDELDGLYKKSENSRFECGRMSRLSKKTISESKDLMERLSALEWAADKYSVPPKVQ